MRCTAIGFAGGTDGGFASGVTGNCKGNGAASATVDDYKNVGAGAGTATKGFATAVSGDHVGTGGPVGKIDCG